MPARYLSQAINDRDSIPVIKTENTRGGLKTKIILSWRN